jgi:hypothetical protein
MEIKKIPKNFAFCTGIFSLTENIQIFCAIKILWRIFSFSNHPVTHKSIPQLFIITGLLLLAKTLGYQRFENEWSSFDEPKNLLS